MEEQDSIKEAVNSSIEALDYINELSESVLNDMKPILKKYNAWLVTLQIMTVISSAGVIPFLFQDEILISLILAILALLTSIGE